MLCETCEKREYCSELCLEAEAYVNQDYVPPYECQSCKNYKYCGVDFMESNLCKERMGVDIESVSPEMIKNFVTKSNEEMIVHLFFIERMKVVEIAKNINVSHPYVSKIVKKYKAILKENLKK